MVYINAFKPEPTVHQSWNAVVEILYQGRINIIPGHLLSTQKTDHG